MSYDPHSPGFQPQEPHKARKRFGQNFLHDDNIIQRIVRAIQPGADDVMVEIGPGQGALTGVLLPQLNHLHVVELDRDLIPRLRLNFVGSLDKLEIHEADALAYDFSQLTRIPNSLRVVGNLPYNISTPLLFHLLDFLPLIRDMHFMLQLEVVERLAAAPGGKDYGRLSVMTQYFCQVEHLFDVPPTAFRPAPKVMSAIVRLAPHACNPYPDTDLNMLGQVLRVAFSHRRKTLRHTLKQFVDDEVMKEFDVDISLRPEQLDVAGFARLAKQISDWKQHTS